MSATGRTPGKRHASDFYETPHPLAEASLKYIRVHFGMYDPRCIFDPGAGLGVWGRAARGIWGPHSHIAGIDIEAFDPGDPPNIGVYDEWHIEDFTTETIKRFGHRGRPADLIVGNPPYRLAQEFIEVSLRLIAPGGLVAFLLRLNFLAGQARREFWREHAPGFVVVCAERPSFTADGGSDATEYALFVWGKRFIGTRIAWMSWRG